MVNIVTQRLPAQNKFGDLLGSSISQGLGEGLTQGMQEAQAMRLARQKEDAMSLQGRNKEEERLRPLQAGLNTIQQMREIGKGGNLGRGSGWLSSLLGGQRAKDFGQYEQLGKSLISLASNIPIRNQKEFETLSAKLYDPTILDEEREGILDAMEAIIRRSAGEQDMPVKQQQETQSPAGPGQPKKRKSLSSFHG